MINNGWLPLPQQDGVDLEVLPLPNGCLVKGVIADGLDGYANSVSIVFVPQCRTEDIMRSMGMRLD